jgi:uncharacterized protein (TIGR02147 family)
MAQTSGIKYKPRKLIVSPMVIKPSVRRFTSYRKFLKAYYDFKKRTKPGFSFRKFAEDSDIKSPNFLQLVMQGKRNMSEEMSAQVCRAMRLVGAERSYFMAMVKRENARNSFQVAEANRGLLRAVHKLDSGSVTTAQSRYVGTWHHAVIKEMVALPDFQPNGEWISASLRGLVTPKQAEESLALLCEAGFLARDAKGNYITQEAVIDTGDGFDFARVLKNHMQTLSVWQELLPSLSKEERDLGLLVFALNKSKIPEFKEKLRQFQDEIVEWIATSELPPDSVMQLGTYLMPLTFPVDGSRPTRERN